MEPKTMIEQTLSQLMDLAIERDRIEHKMGKLHLAARGLLNLVDDKAQREGFKAMLDNYRVRIGLTDLIRLCLTMFDKAMTPVEIRNFIVNFGSEASQQQNLLQSVHTIVKRMEGDLVKEDVNEDGEKAYRLMSVGERMMRIGIEPKDAKKVGDQIENKFDSSKLWGEAFKDEDWLSLGVAEIVVPTIEIEGIQVKTKMPHRTRRVGTPPGHEPQQDAGERMLEAVRRRQREQGKK